MPEKRDNKKKVKYHLCKEIKTSIIEWLNDIVMFFLDQWMMKFTNSSYKKLLKNISITVVLFSLAYTNLELKHY